MDGIYRQTVRSTHLYLAMMFLQSVMVVHLSMVEV